MRNLTKQEQWVLCLILLLVVTGWAVKVYRAAHPPMNARPATKCRKAMQSSNFEEAIRKIVAADDRYQFEAYLFVQEAILYTQKSLGCHRQEEKHVGGKELLNGIRDYLWPLLAR